MIRRLLEEVRWSCDNSSIFVAYHLKIFKHIQKEFPVLQNWNITNELGIFINGIRLFKLFKLARCFISPFCKLLLSLAKCCQIFLSV